MKKRKMTLRQRMRAKADEQLDGLQNVVVAGIERALEENGVELDPYDVMRLFGNKQTKYLREKAVIALADMYENELEKLYNRQQELFPKENSSDND